MANIDKLIPHIIKWEGGAKYTNDPLDRGGATKYGITLNTLQSNHYDINHDGKVGNVTINALNGSNQKDIYNKVWEARRQFYYNIVKNNPSQSKWLHGWLNRLNDLKFSE